MNERIRELAEQAIANVRFWKGCNQESYGVDEYELAKFAELIVRECADVCISATKEGQPLHLVSLGYTQRIKEHFGVE